MNSIINNSLIGLASAKSSINKASENIARSNLNHNVDVKPDINNTNAEELQANQIHDDVDLASEVIDLIQASRNYQFNLKVVDTWSEMLDTQMDILK